MGSVYRRRESAGDRAPPAPPGQGGKLPGTAVAIFGRPLWWTASDVSTPTPRPPKRFNPLQIAASAAGAVIAALIASFFGVEGTVIGTFVGSIVATTASALLWQSIERGHERVRVIVKSADHPFLLHAAGTTGAAGEVTSADVEGTAVEAHVDVGMDDQLAAGGAAPSAGTPTYPAGDLATTGTGTEAVTAPIPTSAAGEASSDVTGTTRFITSSRTRLPGAVRRSTPSSAEWGRGTRRRRWTIVLSVVAAFVVALGVVTVVELIAGRPLSSLVGGSTTTGGTSAGNILSPSATTTTTSSTTTTTSSTTTTTSSTTTTSTTTPSTSTTTTTTPSSTTTTTPSGTTTTTAASIGAPTGGSGGSGSSGG
jgi:hypothetical protein